MPFGVISMRSQVLYRAAQDHEAHCYVVAFVNTALDEFSNDIFGC